MPPKGKSWTPLIERTCIRCAKVFKIRQAEMTSGHHTGQLCGRACATEHLQANPGAPVKVTPQSTKAERVRANGLLNLRVKTGVIVRPDRCSECGKVGKVDGHHDDYSAAKKLDVEWLCRSCHMKRHHKARLKAS